MKSLSASAFGHRLVVAVTYTVTATVVTAATAAAAATTTIHLCGDSTMSRLGGDSSVIQGWGEFLHWSFDPARFTIHNAAMAGRSARSYTREGRFANVTKVVKPGDWVVIEFGHNDGGGLGTKDNGRSDCFGAGNETCTSTYDGATEIVQTYPTYLRQAGAAFLAAGAKLVLSAPTPNNVWESGTYRWSPDRFAYYSWLVAEDLGGPKAGVYFVPHGAYAAQAMHALGADVTNKNYPKDHTHTAPYLADVMAGAFVRGLTCGTSELGKDTLNSTAALSATFLGGCIAYNATVPV
ncbi:GDSL-like Lipase/Acylhydrolase [Niveomyces insectorum RCEF 264]|uniref:GDSL-like Lipase/Acylhydrolase n=1 Tax=Niveomyces insectorum RCEF 264 TaxID=1081102 RepID=A0A167TYP7_9HYPO|nr:GDSL-like Lipase/Acylhydrolase [Niveomyces insectorum RCEF 264]